MVCIFLSAVHGFAHTQFALALTQFVHVAPVQYFGSVALNRDDIYSTEAHVGKYEQLCSKQKTHISSKTSILKIMSWQLTFLFVHTAMQN